MGARRDAGHHRPALPPPARTQYLYIRAERPSKVLELCSAVGYTTLWVLSALQDNGHGELWGFDVYDTAVAVASLPPALLARWHFTAGNVNDDVMRPVLEEHSFDRIIMDADHSDGFTRWYTYSVLERHAGQLAARHPGAPLAITIHDIWNTDERGHPYTEEGAVVVEWLPTLPAASKTCMLMSPVHNDGMRAAVAGVRHAALGPEGDVTFGKSNPECTLFFTIVP